MVLREEAKAIRGIAIADTASGRDLYKELNRLDSAALCLSGGGIRSASFPLGVIQALATHPRKSSDESVLSASKSLLSGFHYLSTVSGGGYIGSWLSAWVTRVQDFDRVWKKLIDRRERPEEEGAEIAWLRSYSNYLTPKLGLLSADTWAAIALYLRNLYLNWMILIPALCVLLLLIKLATVGAFWLSLPGHSPTLFYVLAALALALFIAALAFTHVNRPSRMATFSERMMPRSTVGRVDAGQRDEAAHAGPGANQGTFLRRDLAPALVSAIALTLCLIPSYVPSYVSAHFGSSVWPLILSTALVGAAIYAAAWVIALAWMRYGADRGHTHERLRDFLAGSVAGAVFGAQIGLGIHLYAAMNVGQLIWWLGSGTATILVLLLVGVPWIVTSLLNAEMIFVGLTSWQPHSDSDREWLGRSTGWFAVAATAWGVVLVLVLIGADLVFELLDQLQSWTGKIGSGLVGLGSGIVSAVLGKSRFSPAQGAAKTKTGLSVNVILAITTPIFIISLIVGFSALLDELLLGFSLLKSDLIQGVQTATAGDKWEALKWLLIGFLVATFVAAVASVYVNINRFSLHALYRNRLIRGFLGASTPYRSANPFAGFDECDNLDMHKLWPDADAQGNWQVQSRASWRPFHVINIALNVVSSKRLAWQERKAMPFTVSPLHCGTAGDPLTRAYRRTREYGGRIEGISLGTAVAISGAAASPNMGYHSSPFVSLLLALFNVRLGWWLGNPSTKGNTTYRKEGPFIAIKPFIAEMFGLTTEDNSFVYLSDGGHFENLGIYEMVRRRCRFILVTDGGCDPNFEFEDLGNAVRKIELDLGVPITFHGLTALKSRAADEGDTGGSDAGARPPDLPRHAIGIIDYRKADEAGEPGVILYIKAAYHREIVKNVGVRNYAMGHAAFPHETTGDQFFSESQLESYRALGFEIMDDLLWQLVQSAPNADSFDLKDIVAKLQVMAKDSARP